MSGFGDSAQLQAARELQELFGKPKEPKKGKKKKGGDTFPSTPQHIPQHIPQPSAHQHYRPHKTRAATGLSPAPSQRNYANPTVFLVQGQWERTGRAAAIGTSGLEFLRRHDHNKGKADEGTMQDTEVDKPRNNPSPSIPIPLSPKLCNSNVKATVIGNEKVRKPVVRDFTVAQSKMIFEPDTSALKVQLPPKHATPVCKTSLSTGYPSPENSISKEKPVGNILDTFYALVNRTNTIRQEVEELATRLPGAMDLNAPGTDSTYAQPPSRNSADAVSTVKCEPIDTAHDLNNKACTCDENLKDNNDLRKDCTVSTNRVLRPNAGIFIPDRDIADPGKSGFPSTTAVLGPGFCSAANKDNILESGMSQKATSSSNDIHRRPVMDKLQKGLSTSMWAK